MGLTFIKFVWPIIHDVWWSHSWRIISIRTFHFWPFTHNNRSWWASSTHTIFIMSIVSAHITCLHTEINNKCRILSLCLHTRRSMNVFNTTLNSSSIFVQITVIKFVFLAKLAMKISQAILHEISGWCW